MDTAVVPLASFVQSYSSGQAEAGQSSRHVVSSNLLMVSKGI